MTTAPSARPILIRTQLSLGQRLVIIAVVLIAEAILHTSMSQSLEHIASNRVVEILPGLQHSLFRFMVAYVVLCILLISANRHGGFAGIGVSHCVSPIRPGWIAVHIVSIMLLGGLSFAMYTDAVAVPGLALAAAWLLCGASATAALFAALAPFAVWARAARNHRAVLLYAIAPTVATIIAIDLSQSLWKPAAEVTFDLVAISLRPFLPDLSVDPASLTLGTGRFAVVIAPVCSGLEGVGLMLIFCSAWLWFFRREYKFPRALIVVPVALALTFLLNTVRIAALVLIGDAGYPNVAIVGFHSQAGWIAFNAVAFAVAIVSRHSPWLRHPAPSNDESAVTENPTAPYLVPLMAILAAGMISHALSAGFEFLYPLRLIAGALALWIYRQRYKQLAWSFSWRGVVVGSLIFAMWLIFDRFFNTPHPMSDSLSQLSAPARWSWIVCRTMAAIVTVPICEELAYRGYLMRRFVSRDFDTLAFRDVRWPALVATSIVFGIGYGGLLVPGMIAGAAYGILAIRTEKLGEAIAAHATTNALVAAAVLIFDQWQLW
jgi:exosortase E/protease (VPEID-CTERM system)